jgi:hypothetical protein
MHPIASFVVNAFTVISKLFQKFHFNTLLGLALLAPMSI